MIIQWFGHACFRVESGGYAIVLDPYADGSVPGLPPLRVSANAVLCSHGHGDHNAADLVTLIANDNPSPFTITTVDSFHDDQEGRLRGPNTIHVLETGDIRVAHLGDLGTPLSAQQIAAIGRLDALMLPVGGHYTINARTAYAVAEALQPTLVIPMHFRGPGFGYDVIDTLEPFLRLSTAINRMQGNAIAVAPPMARQVAVLKYP